LLLTVTFPLIDTGFSKEESQKPKKEKRKKHKKKEAKATTMLPCSSPRHYFSTIMGR
jgi:hypothetical protein